MVLAAFLTALIAAALSVQATYQTLTIGPPMPAVVTVTTQPDALSVMHGR